MRRYRNYCLFICCICFVFLSTDAFASSARDRYVKAENCYKNLRKSARKMKYRDNWLRCIEKFKAVYKEDPAGPWAAAGLYKSGELYRKLYKRSYLKADKKEALDIYARVIKRYPQSAYRAKAVKAIRAFSVKSPEKATTRNSGLSKKRFDRAENCYTRLRKNIRKMKYRDKWLACIEKYKAVYQKDPSGPWTSAALYTSGELFSELYKRSYLKADKKEALDIYARVIRQYPSSDFKVKAEAAIRIFPQRVTGPAIAEKKPVAKTKVQAPADPIAGVIQKSYQADSITIDDPGPVDGSRATVTGLRFWSNPNYTRIVIDADSEPSYAHHLLKKDPSIQKPQRLYIDLNDSILGKDTIKTIPINDNLLSDVRAGQYTLDSVRVVIDIKSFKTYKIFSLKNPFRIVIDVWGETKAVAAKDSVRTKTAKKGGKLAAGALAKQLALGVSRIIIDPGHGGRDYGAPGYIKGVHEKHIVLDIAKKLARKIEQQLGCEVIMTRKTDRYLTLEERTAIANTKNADLFISIHTNSVRDRRAYGLETYFLNLATDDEAIRVAARENATSTKNISDLQTILNDLMHNAKVNESSRLAAYVQESLYYHMKKRYSRIKNKGVKQAPFYVLLGAQMPSILIETSFISNPRECKRLKNSRYQDQLSDGIIKGIRKYIKETNPTAIFKPSLNARRKG